jgi:hypothetical protein
MKFRVNLKNWMTISKFCEIEKKSSKNKNWAAKHILKKFEYFFFFFFFTFFK